MRPTRKKEIKEQNSLSASTERKEHISRPKKRGYRSTHKLKSTEEGTCRTRNKSELARGTHSLRSTQTCQEIERKQDYEGHSLPGEHRERDLSGHGKKETEEGALTLWRPHREGLVRIRKKRDRARGTHSLETASGGTCQDTGRK